MNNLVNTKSGIYTYVNGTLHENLGVALNTSVAAGGDILPSAATMPFDGTAIIDLYVSAATTISAIINGTSATIYTFSAAGYVQITLELALGDTLNLSSSAAATISATVGAKV